MGIGEVGEWSNKDAPDRVLEWDVVDGGMLGAVIVCRFPTCTQGIIPVTGEKCILCSGSGRLHRVYGGPPAPETPETPEVPDALHFDEERRLVVFHGVPMEVPTEESFDVAVRMARWIEDNWGNPDRAVDRRYAELYTLPSFVLISSLKAFTAAGMNAAAFSQAIHSMGPRPQFESNDPVDSIEDLESVVAAELMFEAVSGYKGRQGKRLESMSDEERLELAHLMWRHLHHMKFGVQRAPQKGQPRWN